MQQAAPNESGAIERIGGQLTRSERYFIVHGIPEGSMSREISLIWEIPANLTKATAYAGHRLWITRNVAGVLRYLKYSRTNSQRSGREV
jgi:hypothetical protein